MNEALCSILCGEDRWNFHMEDNRSIKFNKDGTGEVCTSSPALSHVPGPIADYVCESYGAVWMFAGSSL